MAAALPKVLVIGLDPLKLDPVEWGVTAEHNAAVRAMIDASHTALRAAGYAADNCLLGIGDDLGAALTQQLKEQAWACVVVGGGIRKPEQLVDLFERVVNAVHRHAPQAVIAFNSRPDDVLMAVQRALGRP